MTDTKEALKRLSAIRDGSEGYAAAIMDAYGFLPVGQFYADLETLIAAAQRGAGEGFDGEGHVYWSPDVGIEYALQHPVASGETPDAQHVRASTGFEDELVRQIGELRDERDLLAGRMTVEGVAKAAESRLEGYRLQQGRFGDTAARMVATALISYLTGGDESKDNSSS